jgi:hypothetical protein
MIRLSKKEKKQQKEDTKVLGFAMSDWTDEDWDEYIAFWSKNDNEVLIQVEQAIAPLLIEEEA